ncbi:hypothetical protein CRE_05952 [Caenorhabditis remanei]|uniref:DUF19 domain-containing protein n=1 Tax=Caenorhabditis remanei TaxID=31234 RepID=E3MZG0_CAERE|nr:hypothetical protein CRE_05952 [Caenorhabditis remanei]
MIKSNSLLLFLYYVFLTVTADHLDDGFMKFNVSKESSETCNEEFEGIKTCLTNVAVKYNNGSEDTTILMDKQIMLSLMEDFENASCFNSCSNCTNVKLGKHIYDALYFIGEKIYRHGFECIRKEYQKLVVTGKHCINMIVVSGEVKDRSFNAFLPALKKVGECVVSRLNCSFIEKSALVAATYRTVDLVDGFIHPEKMLDNIGVARFDISMEEVSSILSFFTSFF